MLDNELLFNNIKELCDNKNIKITNLEKELKFGGGIISRWGNGADPSLSKIIDIADYFGVPLDEVVGRNINSNDNSNQKDDIIMSLMQMTDNKEIKWKFISNYKNLQLHGESYEDVFNLYIGDEIEIYKCQYYDSNLFLIVQYDIEQGIIENLDIELYLQPDVNSNPVLQNICEKHTEEFWIDVREQYKGIPDEWKASMIRKQITEQNGKMALDTIQQCVENIPDNTNEDIDKLLSDKKTKKILTEENSQELLQLISLFTNPKITQAMDSAQKLIQYFSDIDSEKKKLYNDNLEEQNNKKAGD